MAMQKKSPGAALVAGAVLLLAAAGFEARADDALSIDAGLLDTAGCFGQASCDLDGATITATGGPIIKKTEQGESGFGVGNGASGTEIDVGQNLRVDFDATRTILAIKVLFLFNGPEFSDRAEKARITVDGKAYTLSVRNDADDAAADWSGPGSVAKCGTTTASGTG
jgi:hypothetical protein